MLCCVAFPKDGSRPMAAEATILPDPRRLHLVRLRAAEDSITAVVETTQAAAACPICGSASSRVHARYVRRIPDLPWHGVRFGLQLCVRRFFCDHFGCTRRIFTERLLSVVAPMGAKRLGCRSGCARSASRWVAKRALGSCERLGWLGSWLAPIRSCVRSGGHRCHLARRRRS